MSVCIRKQRESLFLLKLYLCRLICIFTVPFSEGFFALSLKSYGTSSIISALRYLDSLSPLSDYQSAIREVRRTTSTRGEMEFSFKHSKSINVATRTQDHRMAARKNLMKVESVPTENQNLTRVTIYIQPIYNLCFLYLSNENISKTANMAFSQQ